jgi:hypothetical protein
MFRSLSEPPLLKSKSGQGERTLIELKSHIEGETAKAPSWWLKSVRVKFSVGDLYGTWLQTSMEAVADVRLLGFHTLTSNLLDYRGTHMSASTMLAPRP